MARQKTKTKTQATNDYKSKTYDRPRIEVRKEYEFPQNIKKAAALVGETQTAFITRAAVERARALGIPFENGPFFDEEASEPENDDD